MLDLKVSAQVMLVNTTDVTVGTGVVSRRTRVFFGVWLTQSRAAGTTVCVCAVVLYVHNTHPATAAEGTHRIGMPLTTIAEPGVLDVYRKAHRRLHDVGDPEATC